MNTTTMKTTGTIKKTTKKKNRKKHKIRISGFFYVLKIRFFSTFVELQLGSTLDLTAIEISVGSMQSVVVKLLNILLRTIIDNTSYALAA